MRQAGIEVQLSLSETELSFKEEGGTAKVTVTTDAKWKASSNATWCAVSPSEGTGNGELTLQVGVNYSTATRSATVTVSASDVSCTINVKQDGPDVFLVTPAYVEISAGGGTFEVTVTTGRAYHISSMPAWVSEVSVDNQVHTFSVGANTSGARTDVIVFCDESGACTPVVVKQLGTS